MSAALDTSGVVCAQIPDHDDPFAFRFEDLSPFEQGCIEALLDDLDKQATTSAATRFRSLAGETLTSIRKECAAFNLKIGDASHNRGLGAQFLKARQAGFATHWSLHQREMANAFPRLTITIAADNRVYLRTAP